MFFKKRKALITENERLKQQLKWYEQPKQIIKPIERPIKRLTSVYVLQEPSYLELPDELIIKKVADQICKELKDYIVFEWNYDEGKKTLRGSIDIIGRI